MTDWIFAQTDPTDQLAKLHHFSITKTAENGSPVEFVITVREYVTPKDPMMKFFATSDRQTNQKALPYTPCAWARTLLQALSECIVAIHKFPYQG
ncbi:MAG: hypothetical protein ABI823_06890 [Bryobacteraceae bacterium]